LLLALSTPVQAASCPPPDTTLNLTVGDQPLTVAVASTPKTRHCGLSHRTELRSDFGMLFVFPHRQPLTFWMKDTLVPLSIAFLDGSGEILAIKRMQPDQPMRRYRSPAPARYALEVAQGWFARNGLQPGDHCHFRLPAGLPVH
jgi:hypothetical protein